MCICPMLEEIPLKLAGSLRRTLTDWSHVLSVSRCYGGQDQWPGVYAAPHTGQSHQHSTTLWTRHHQPRVQITFPPPAGQADTVCHLADISHMIGWLLAAAAVI